MGTTGGHCRDSWMHSPKLIAHVIKHAFLCRSRRRLTRNPQWVLSYLTKLSQWCTWNCSRKSTRGDLVDNIDSWMAEIAGWQQIRIRGSFSFKANMHQMPDLLSFILYVGVVITNHKDQVSYANVVLDIIQLIFITISRGQELTMTHCRPSTRWVGAHTGKNTWLAIIIIMSINPLSWWPTMSHGIL